MRSATTPWFRFNFADELVKRSPTDRQLEDQPTDATFNDAHHGLLCLVQLCPLSIRPDERGGMERCRTLNV
jgi:hypothetical protein